MKLKILYILIIVTAIAAIYCEIIDSSLYNYLKPLTTILIIQLVVLFGEKAKNRYKKQMIIGLVFCLVGDILLLDSDRFIYGLGAFLIAHLVFVFAFYSRHSNKPNIISLIPFSLIGGSYYGFLLPSLGALAVPVAVYVTVIVLMSWQALELFLNCKSRAHAAVLSGAVLFMISDSVLAFNKFVSGFSYSSAAILLTYWLAITLFAYSTLPDSKRSDVS